MFVALMLAWSLLVVSRVILLNGEERFGIDQWMPQDTVKGRDLLLASLPTIPWLVCASVEKWRNFGSISWLTWFAAAVGGALLAYIAGFVGLVFSITLAPRYRRLPAEKRFDIPFPYSKKILGWAEEFRLIRLQDPDRLARWAMKRLPADLRSGYLDYEGHLFPGHWLVLILMLISLVVYFGLGAFRGTRIGMPTSVPAITYVLILIMVLTWILSVMAFFLDRYRVPLLLPIVLFSTLAGQFPQSDHYFALRDGVAITPVSPAATLASHGRRQPRPSNPNGGVVVVATAGGGIQAAGWTARVLTGLQEQCSEQPSANFAESVAAISAVSGGAVGTLFFMNQYNTSGALPGFHATQGELKTIVEQAESPALSGVAWAIAYLDPGRMLLPYLRTSEEDKIRDRGFVLEQTWSNRGSIHAYLSNWREGVVEGWRPAVIFNATIAETGQPFLMSTSDFDTGQQVPTRQTLTRAYPNSDIPVVTATRLAASFPFVSPASRPLTSKPEYHLVDGGYYDNFGVDSLAAWLNQGLTNLPTGKLPDVLFIQIRSFPTDAFPGAVNKGWFYQSYAPGNALLSVRTTAQLVRDREELALLKEKWAAQERIRMEFATFEFSGHKAPLSWELTQQQKDEIEHQWQTTLTDATKKKDLETVRSFCNPQSRELPASASAPR